MSIEEEKKVAGEKAAEYIKDGQIVGLGSGSTVKYFFDALAKKIDEQGIGIVGVPTSESTKEYCESTGIPIFPIGEIEKIDVAVDGADEVDPDFFMIKGGGGCHTREKVIATRAKQLIIVADSSKMVTALGKFPVAVEALQELSGDVQYALEELGCTPALRGDFITDNGNIIFDCQFKEITDPMDLEIKINEIEGVVDNGLFSRRPEILIIGQSGNVQVFERNSDTSSEE